MLGECQVNVKSQSELDIGGRETCFVISCHKFSYVVISCHKLGKFSFDHGRTDRQSTSARVELRFAVKNLIDQTSNVN